jgi:hypothetical protein
VDLAGVGDRCADIIAALPIEFPTSLLLPFPQGHCAAHI